jgi:hypothetical protein
MTATSGLLTESSESASGTARRMTGSPYCSRWSIERKHMACQHGGERGEERELTRKRGAKKIDKEIDRYVDP